MFKRCSRRTFANFLRKSVLSLRVYLNERSRIDFTVFPIVSVQFRPQTLCRKIRASPLPAGTAGICDKSLKSGPTRDEAETVSVEELTIRSLKRRSNNPTCQRLLATLVSGQRSRFQHEPAQQLLRHAMVELAAKKNEGHYVFRVPM